MKECIQQAKLNFHQGVQLWIKFRWEEWLRYEHCKEVVTSHVQSTAQSKYDQYIFLHFLSKKLNT